MPLTVLAIQSHVVAGHGGNDATTIALQQFNVKAWPIFTIQFPNRPGNGASTKQAFDAVHMGVPIDGPGARGYLQHPEHTLATELL